MSDLDKDMRGGRIIDLGAPFGPDDAARLVDVQEAVSRVSARAMGRGGRLGGGSTSNPPVPSSFLDLTDTPATYAGSAGFQVIVNAGADALIFAAIPPGVTTFLGLTDTPGSYVGNALEHVRVNAAATALEFSPPTFLEDTDTPAAYAGSALFLVRVNAGATALEFVSTSSAITFQNVYDASTVQPQIVVSAANGGLDFRDAAVPIGTFLERWSDNAGAVTFFSVSTAQTFVSPSFRVEDAATNPLIDATTTNIQIGLMDTSEAIQIPVNTTSKDAIFLLPDDITDVVVPTNFGLLTWASTYTASFAAARFGGMIFAIGTVEFTVNANAFNGLNLFLNAATIKGASGSGVSLGSDFTLIDQPTYQGDGAACTQIQHNGVRSFPTFDGINGGTLATTNSVALIAGTSVLTGATLTNRRVVHAFSPTVTGALTNNIVIEIDNQLTGTNRFGIRSAMATGTFIQQNGVAISTFAGDVHMNDGISLVLGSTGGSRVELLRPFAGAMRMIGVGGADNEGLDWDFQNPDNVAVTSSTSAGLNFDLIEIAFGPSTIADGTNNWVFAFSPGLRATQLAGDYSEVLFTSSAAISIAHAITNFATWTVNAPTIVLTVGSITSAANVLIQTNMAQGTNRYGLLITSNPSGGGGENRALRVENGSSLFNHLENEGGRTMETRRDTAGFTLTRGIGGDQVEMGDTDGGGFTVNLPAAPVTGDTFWIKNVGSSANTLTVGRNGNNINGVAANATLADGVGAVYIFETTEGWQSAWGS